MPANDVQKPRGGRQAEESLLTLFAASVARSAAARPGMWLAGLGIVVVANTALVIREVVVASAAVGILGGALVQRRFPGRRRTLLIWLAVALLWMAPLVSHRLVPDPLLYWIGGCLHLAMLVGGWAIAVSGSPGPRARRVLWGATIVGASWPFVVRAVGVWSEFVLLGVILTTQILPLGIGALAKRGKWIIPALAVAAALGWREWGDWELDQNALSMGLVLGTCTMVACAARASTMLLAGRPGPIAMDVGGSIGAWLQKRPLRAALLGVALLIVDPSRELLDNVDFGLGYALPWESDATDAERIAPAWGGWARYFLSSEGVPTVRACMLCVLFHVAVRQRRVFEGAVALAIGVLATPVGVFLGLWFEQDTGTALSDYVEWFTTAPLVWIAWVLPLVAGAVTLRDRVGRAVSNLDRLLVGLLAAALICFGVLSPSRLEDAFGSVLPILGPLLQAVALVLVHRLAMTNIAGVHLAAGAIVLGLVAPLCAAVLLRDPWSAWVALDLPLRWLVLVPFVLLVRSVRRVSPVPDYHPAVADWLAKDARPATN